MNYIELPEQKVIEMYLSNNHTMSEICKYFKVSKFKIRKVLLSNNILSKSSKKYNYNDDIFEVIDSEQKSYWLGFLFADGYVRNRKSSSELKLKLASKDISHLLKFKKFMSLDDIPVVDYISGNSNCSSISVNSKKIVDDLIHLGCVNKKSLIIKFPKLEKKLVHHFIRGYFDGDGWISIKRNNTFNFGIASGSYEMLESLNDLLSEHSGIMKINIKQKNSNLNTLTYSSVTDIIKIYHYLYKDSNISLERKKQKFEEVIKYFQNHKNKNKNRWN